MNLKSILKDWSETRSIMYRITGQYTLPADIKYRDNSPLHNWFTNKDLKGITYRTINYWDEKGYLTGVANEGSKWRKFDFVQLIWIQFLEKCRQLGISLELIIPVIFNSYGYIPDSLELEKDSKINSLSTRERDDLKLMLGNYQNFQNLFRFWVLRVVFLKLPVSIRYYSDGTCTTMVSDKKVFGNTDENVIQRQSYISISINELVKNFIEHQPIDIIKSTEVVTEQELEIIRHLRTNSVNEAIIKLKNGSPEFMELHKRYDNIELNKRLYEYMTNPYEQMEVKINGNNRATIISKTKIKF